MSVRKLTEYLEALPEAVDWGVCTESDVLRSSIGGLCASLGPAELREVSRMLSDQAVFEAEGLALLGMDWVLAQHARNIPFLLIPKKVQHRKAHTLAVKPLPQGFVVVKFRASPPAAACHIDRATALG